MKKTYRKQSCLYCIITPITNDLIKMALINILWLILACLGSYLLGSIPFSVWIGKLLKGIDLREHNIKNPGGMNAVMTFGRAIGLAIMLLDFGKGALLIGLIDHIFSLEYFTNDGGIWYTLAVILGPMFGILGHNYPVWLKFKGGQGLGVFMGAIWYLNPLLFTFYALGVMFIVVVVKMNVRYGTMVVILLDIVFSLFMPISPPWVNIHLNEFIWSPSFMNVKLMFIFLGMFVMLFLRAAQAVVQKKKSASWTVSTSGERIYDEDRKKEKDRSSG